MRKRSFLISTIIISLISPPLSAQYSSDEKGRVIACPFKKLPKIVINTTPGRETLMVGFASFTAYKGSGFWSAGPYIIAFNEETPDHKGVKIWAQDQKSGIEERVICRSKLRSR